MVRATVYEELHRWHPSTKRCHPASTAAPRGSWPILTDALVDLGHDVVLFASADARTKARLVPGRDQAIRLDPHPLKSDLAAHLSMLHELHRRADEFDILHFHVDLIHFPFFEELAQRTVTTLHGRLDLKDLAGPTGAGRTTCWSRSPATRGGHYLANWIATIAHGVRQSLYRFTPEPADGGYLAFWAGSRPRSGPTGRSRSPSGPGSASRSRPRSTPPTGPTSRKRSSPCSAIP